MSAFWLVTVTNGPGTKGDVLPIEAATEAKARQIALDVTPGLDEVLACEPITAEQFVKFSTPPAIPPGDYDQPQDEPTA